MRFQICEADQKRFGAPEWLEYDARDITVADLNYLSERFGFDPNDWPEPFQGQLTLEQAGDPDAQPKPPPWRNQAMCWMLLRQTGFPVSWDEAADMHFFRLRVDLPDEVLAEMGKGPTTPARRSAPSGASTTRRSGTSTASRRKKST